MLQSDKLSSYYLGKLCLNVCRDGSGAILDHIKLPASTCCWVKCSYMRSTTKEACSPTGIQFLPDSLVSKRGKLTSDFSVVEPCEASLFYTDSLVPRKVWASTTVVLLNGALTCFLSSNQESAFNKLLEIQYLWHYYLSVLSVQLANMFIT